MGTETLMRHFPTRVVRSSIDAPSADAALSGLSAPPSTGRSSGVPKTAAGERAIRRRRARVSADRRPPSGMLPSGDRTAAVVSSDRGDQADERQFRLGRWARFTCTVMVLGAGTLLVVVLLSAGRPQVISQVTVVPGDSLWSIAERAEPGVDPRSVIDQIKELNGLDDGSLAIGVVLNVPTAGN